ncbi:nicotinamide riboside transporter PnuC [Nonlabens ponticola]|uniref:Nicotinamide riboside transporter PnuC n=1 Tax=Nonlabens ponticola TaxID=2496866 RepID=A0A3S9MVQ9_9FLAO|nr:nicotinamide riboside transporter PnuC [Nonlabens ponticola]AZQ43288.1 nicotinamide riboside transporter PnuC [Nonlabens ponticola]
MEVWDFVFGQYKDYPTSFLWLELVACACTVISALCSWRNSIWVFPFGIVSTSIFTYLCLQWNLLGDTLINAYYFIMSIYGWYIWSRKVDKDTFTPITRTNMIEWYKTALLFIASAIFVYMIYWYFDRFETIVSYADIITTGFFFSGMYLMALRKIEHWLVLLIGNVISVPLYFYKGYSFSAILYIILIVLVFIGYQQWKKYLNNPDSVVAG